MRDSVSKPAEDLLQSAYARLYPRWHRVREYDSPDAYLRRVMVKQNSSWGGGRDREVPVDDLTSSAGVAGASSSLAEVEVAKTINCSLNAANADTSRGLAVLSQALSPEVEESATG